jgi:hypothetical protein
MMVDLVAAKKNLALLRIEPGSSTSSPVAIPTEISRLIVYIQSIPGGKFNIPEGRIGHSKQETYIYKAKVGLVL